MQYLYSDAGQRIAAKNFYRPRNQKTAAEYAKQFPSLKLVSIDKDFNDGGVFDQIYSAQ